MVCAASNEDAENVAELVSLYYEAGCRFFDVSANADVLRAAKTVAPDGFFCVSVAAPGDPHCRPWEPRSGGGILSSLIEMGIDCIELHAACETDITSQWKWLKENFDGLLSLCVSRAKLSDTALLKRVRECAPDIIQADGLAMTGGEDDYAATLQAVATAQMLQTQPGYLLISGGTNTKTAQLAHLCGVRAHGVAVGSFARQLKTVGQAKHLIEENLKWLK